MVDPIYVIRPFRPQGVTELTLALIVMRFRPVITIISALAAIGAVAWFWRASIPRWLRILTTAGAALVCMLAALARINVYELMFHPLDRASFLPVAQAKLDSDEKVIAVKIGNAARAYPIRSISYHHIVNDEVDKLAIVATY